MPQQTTLTGCNFVDGDLFKATLLWEKIVTHLEKSIKCGRHTQALRSYTNCFQGSKAVDCLLVHLNSVLPKTVQRHQVQTLCNKLVLTGVIEDVKDKDKGVFREGRLYRLTKNHFWANPLERKLPRTRSAEEICTEKEPDIDDMKGYASDSTVDRQSSHGGHPSGQEESTPLIHRKKKYRERLHDTHHHSKEHKPSRAHSRLPSGSGLLRMKSTGSIFTTPDSTPSSALCESRESLLFDTKHRQRYTTHHGRPSRPDIGSHNDGGALLGPLRRCSVDSGSPRGKGPGGGASCKPRPDIGSYNDGVGGGALLGLRRCSVDSGSPRGRGHGGVASCKPPLHTRRKSRARDESSRHSKGKEEMTLRCRHQSYSLKGEEERTPGANKDSVVVGKSLNRSQSFSSVGQGEHNGGSDHGVGASASCSPDGGVVGGTGAGPGDPMSPRSGNKWIVYGFL